MVKKPSLAPGYCRLPTLVTVGLAVGHPRRVDSTNGGVRAATLGDLLRSAGVGLRRTQTSSGGDSLARSAGASLVLRSPQRWPGEVEPPRWAPTRP